jgi:hypothetical protein
MTSSDFGISSKGTGEPREKFLVQVKQSEHPRTGCCNGARYSPHCTLQPRLGVITFRRRLSEFAVAGVVEAGFEFARLYRCDMVSDDLLESLMAFLHVRLLAYRTTNTSSMMVSSTTQI